MEMNEEIPKIHNYIAYTDLQDIYKLSHVIEFLLDTPEI